MHALLSQPSAPMTFELRFTSLFRPGYALSFPCDARGNVDIDRLSARARANYLYARAMVGRDYPHPVVQRRAETCAALN